MVFNETECYFMKKFVFPLISLLIVLLLGSCASSKKVAYFQNIDQVDLSGSRGLYEAKIMPKDMLTITVSTIQPEASAPFNLNSASKEGGATAPNYLVDNSGDINFPILGKLHVLGLSKNECQDLIAKKMRPYLSETEVPIVTVRMSSYRITVLGEVGHPGVIPVSTEKISIIEALAQAGDLTIYGKRDNIMLIRENDTGQKTAFRFNLNDANLINSPYFYLQQNDIVYVEPNSVKAKGSSIGPSTSLWFSFFGIATSLASLLFNILR